MIGARRGAALIFAGLLLAGCDNGSSNRGGGTPTSSTQSVQGLAASSSESNEPFTINNGAFAFNDTSETSDPRSINR